MKKLLLIISAFLISVNTQLSQAQCTIDSSFTVAGIYPDSLPDGTAGQTYSQDITFVLLTDTLGLTIYNYEITSIVGLPIGLTWQCNNFANGCNYDPSVSIYGCVNISGTPILAGTYTATVTVIADVQLAGNQTINYDMPLTIQPGVISNPGFSMTNSTGCTPLTVTFTNNNPGQASYLWDFGNGLQSNLENPPPQTYSIPGDYIITQTVTPNTLPDYFLTALTVNSIPNNYGGPIDDPDMYFLLRNQAGTVIYDSHPSLNGVFPPYTWTLPNIQLANETYSVHVWDEDGGLFGADDDLGEINFAGWGPSGNATGTVGGASGTLNVYYNIFQTPINPLIATDTVHVYPVPDTPSVSASGPLVFCENDSVVLTCSDSVNVQWFESGSIMVGVTTQSITVTSSGNYSVVVNNTYGCTAASAVTVVTVNPNPPKPTFFINGNTFTTGLTGYFLQWYLNGIAIPGANGSSYFAGVAGTYTLTATDTNGCFNISDTLAFIPVSITDYSGLINNFSVAPNPSKGNFTLFFDMETPAELTVDIHDIVGKNIYSTKLNALQGRNEKLISIADAQQGIYFLKMNCNGVEWVRKIVVDN